MKRILLLLMTLVLAVSGIKAAPSISKDGSTITLSGFNAGDLAKVFAGEIEGISAEDFSGVSSIVFGSGCALNADDFTAMSSTTHSELSGVKTVDMSNATVSVDTSEGSTATAISTMSGMNLSAMEYLRLPDGMTSADDVAAMANLHSSSKNASLKMAGAYKDDTLDEVALYSFTSNSVQGFQAAMMSSVWSNIKVARLAGQYGNSDLDKGNEDLVFSSKPAEWDFTGANFDACTVNGTFSFANNSEYYSETDPFEEGTDGGKPAPLTGLSDFQTNAFYYFKGYASSVVKLELPDRITEIPPFCLQMLGKENKDNYKLYYGLDDDGFNAISDDGASVAIEHLKIPNSVTTVGYECAYNTKIKKISFGSGLEVVQGGAFKQVSQLQDIEFSAGISNCYLGDEAFQLCYDVKHIVLCEGIVSIGAGCFQNSQQMESIRLPQSLQYIGNDAFNLCVALGSITIPPNVKKIGKRAFKLTALRDIYLTTTDPDGVPEIFTVGTSFVQNVYDQQATFSLNQMEGYNTVPYNNTTPYSAGLNSMTWDEAMEWYYINACCMSVLHYPEELADRVRARITETYGTQSSDGIGLPIRDSNGDYQVPDDDPYDDVYKRASGNAPGLSYPPADLGTKGNGKFSKDGWAQFLLMKGYVPEEESTVYTKKYKDVWYTMCFPFELTDEQLAATFNEGFNIADFSGVQIKDPSVPEDNVDKKTLVLHFNKVAETLYKDPEKKLYERKTDGSGNIIREQDGTTVMFDYNVYIRNGQEYHHVIVATGEAAVTKTKTFAPGSSLADAANHKDQAVIIDGYLASAGHPYMIHPNTGILPTQAPVDCYFSGITWIVGDDEGVANGDTEAKSTDQVREELYEAEARTVDLGVENTANNFDQRGYTNLNGKNYTGQKYTFKGNYRELSASAPASVVNAKEPVVTDYTQWYPDGPPQTMSAPENTPEAQVGPRMTEADKPEEKTDPRTDEAYPEVFQTFYNTVFQFNGQDRTAGEEILNWQFSSLVNPTIQNWGVQVYQFTCNMEGLQVALKTYFGDTYDNKSAITASLFSETALNTLKGKCQAFHDALEEYSDYPATLAAYEANVTAWAAYDAAVAAAASYSYETEKTNYDTAITNWENAVKDWNNTRAPYKVLIPQYAYFLGTAKNATYPKYWRETAPDNVPRTTGLWTQYSAIILPNAAALAGLETELGGVTTSSGTGSTPGAKSHDIAFDEKYFFIDDTPQGIATLIEKIEKEEGKAPEVEYMDIVVSIDGKIVSRDKTTFEGLPKGVYIINGKKYYVK